MYNKEKIGVGLITFNRPQHFERVFKSLMSSSDRFDEVIIVKDGGGVSYERQYQDEVPMIEFIDNGCNCRSKTTAWSYLITQGCKHIFLMEDDMIIKDPCVFEQYIKTAEMTGIHHLMYCGVGGDNPKKMTVKYSEDTGIDLYQNYQGPFMYATADLIKEIGGWDMGFKNAFTHVDWSYRCSLADRIPPMWWAPDIKNSTDYIECIPECIQGSSNSEDMEKYKKNLDHSINHWMKKYGKFTNQIPHTPQEDVTRTLKKIKENYGQKI
jgi:glycosyltransferase involved in cell wall biosynthesis